MELESLRVFAPSGTRLAAAPGTQRFVLEFYELPKDRTSASWTTVNEIAVTALRETLRRGRGARLSYRPAAGRTPQRPVRLRLVADLDGPPPPLCTVQVRYTLLLGQPWRTGVAVCLGATNAPRFEESALADPAPGTAAPRQPAAPVAAPLRGALYAQDSDPVEESDNEEGPSTTDQP